MFKESLKLKNFSINTMKLCILLEYMNLDEIPLHNYKVN